MRAEKSRSVECFLAVALFMLALTGWMAISRFLEIDPTAEVIKFQAVR